MKFYQNIGHFASLIVLAVIISISSVLLTDMQNGASKTLSQSEDEAESALTRPEEAAYIAAENVSKPDLERITDIVPSDAIAEENGVIKRIRRFNFENGDIFDIVRYEYTDKAAGPVSETIYIPGSEIEIRSFDENGQWHCTSDTDKTAESTLFIDTDKCSVIISAPAVYRDRCPSSTLERIPELENGISLTKTDSGYVISYGFPHKEGIFGEIWYLRSEHRLADWDNGLHSKIMGQDMNRTQRFSMDGYYLLTPYNYEPAGENVFYRHSGNYVGASFVRMGDIPAAYDLGYVMTYTCMKNCNTQGYWATGPKSEWLFTDFGIGNDFYDTRFNTDFASSLLDAYKRYGNTEFIYAAARYAEYFKEHAANHSYPTANGGVLVEDYASFDGSSKRTHVSLNHHLAEMNFLYRLYSLTSEESYRELADKMLLGIEDTCDLWIRGDNNLNYALYYTGTYNTLQDYPYLTYNDLYITKKLLDSCFNKTSPAVERLMAAKLEWMQANNITGYYK